MSSEQIDVEYVREHREEVDRPLWQLFQRCGRGSRRWFLLGVLASIGARFASLAPPVLLGVTIDAIFGSEEFDLPLIPQG